MLSLLTWRMRFYGYHRLCLESEPLQDSSRRGYEFWRGKRDTVRSVGILYGNMGSRRRARTMSMNWNEKTIFVIRAGKFRVF